MSNAGKTTPKWNKTLHWISEKHRWKKCRWYTNEWVPLPHILFLKLVCLRHFSSLFQALPPVLVSTTITFTTLYNN